MADETAPITPEQASLEARCREALAALGAAWRLVRHPPIQTVAEGRALRSGDAMPGLHSKSLLTKDKEGAFFLITAVGESRVDLKRVVSAAGAAGRLSFASADELFDVLAVRPGSVSPLALLNDRASQISAFVIDADLMAGPPLWCHPLHNAASIALLPGDLLGFAAQHATRHLTLDLAQR